MNFWQQPWFQEIAREVLIALLLAILSVLGYDRTIGQALRRRISHLQTRLRDST